MIRRNIINRLDKSKSVKLTTNKKVVFPSECTIYVSADSNGTMSFNGTDYAIGPTKFFMVSIVGNTYIGHRFASEEITGFFGTIKTREITNNGPGVLWINIL